MQHRKTSTVLTKLSVTICYNFHKYNDKKQSDTFYFPIYNKQHSDELRNKFLKNDIDVETVDVRHDLRNSEHLLPVVHFAYFLNISPRVKMMLQTSRSY